MLSVTLLCVASLAQTNAQPSVQPPMKLAIASFAATIDGDLTEWKSLKSLKFGREQVFRGAGSWRGNKDLSASFLVSWDNNRLYLAGTVLDDQIVGDEVVTPDEIDCLELHIGSSALDPASRAERSVLRLFPLRAHRPWVWGGGEQGVAQDSLKPITQLAGIEIVGKRLNAGSYVFEAAIPFHHFPNLKPGTETLGFDLVLRDFDAGSGSEATAMSWSKTDPFDGPRAGMLALGAPGLMAPVAVAAPLLSNELLVDLPYLLVPLLSLLALIMLMRGWARIRGRVRWLRTVLVVFGVAAFLIGLWLPTLLTSFRADEQRERLQAGLKTLQATMPLLEAGSLGSYRGASRDRAVVDLVSGRPIERQRYAQYRSLVEIAPDQFGPPVRSFDDLPVRCYWLPLASERAASFQFDPPLRGRKLNLVLGRPYAPSVALIDPRPPAILDVEIDIDGEKQQKTIDLDLPFDDATSLGRDFWEARVVPIDLGQEVRTLAELRSLTIGCTGHPDMRLVGISLEGEQQGSIEPLSLGEPWSLSARRGHRARPECRRQSDHSRRAGFARGPVVVLSRDLPGLVDVQPGCAGRRGRVALCRRSTEAVDRIRAPSVDVLRARGAQHARRPSAGVAGFDCDDVGRRKSGTSHQPRLSGQGAAAGYRVGGDRVPQPGGLSGAIPFGRVRQGGGHRAAGSAGLSVDSRR